MKILNKLEGMVLRARKSLMFCWFMVVFYVHAVAAASIGLYTAHPVWLALCGMNIALFVINLVEIDEEIANHRPV